MESNKDKTERNKTRREVTRGQASFQMGGAPDGSKSQEGSMKYETCLIFCRPTTTNRKVQPTLTDSVNIAPDPQKIHCH